MLTNWVPRMMRVLLISNLFPTPADPARGIFTAQLARRLQMRCDMTIVCPLPWLPPGTRRRVCDSVHHLANVPREYDVDRLRVLSPKYAMVPGQPRARAVSMCCALLRSLSPLHRCQRFDVINSHWLHPDGVASTWLGRCLNVPVVLTGLGSDVNLRLSDPRVRRQIVRALGTADGVTVKSAMLRARIASEGIPFDRIRVIHNGVDSAQFTIRDRDASARALELPVGERRVVFVGKLSAVKGVNYLLRAFGRLVARRRDVTLYIVGEGAERPAYERIVQEEGVGRHVRFVGAQHPHRIPLWLGAADLLCLPSLYEGCPNVLLEALASGRPIVASEVGGVPELMPPEAGLLVHPGDVDGLTSALERALVVRWNASAIRTHALSRSWEIAADGYHAAYQAVISARAPTVALPRSRAGLALRRLKSAYRIPESAGSERANWPSDRFWMSGTF